MTKISPIAAYLRANKAIAKRDAKGCSFVSPEGMFLGRLTKSVVNNYNVTSLSIVAGAKKMFTKSVALGNQYAYVKNDSAPLGVMLAPVKILKRKIFVDFINRTCNIEDSEKKLTNALELIAIDEVTGVGLFDIEKPFEYSQRVIKSEKKGLRKKLNLFSVN